MAAHQHTTKNQACMLATQVMTAKIQWESTDQNKKAYKIAGQAQVCAGLPFDGCPLMDAL